MITEDYVSFETAKLLKESGFNVPCRSNYRSEYYKDPRPFYHNFPKDFNGKEYENLNSEWYSAPTLQMAMKWLREVYNLYIDITVVASTPMQFTNPIYNKNKNEWVNMYSICDSYERACEIAIKYCLEHLI